MRKLLLAALLAGGACTAQAAANADAAPATWLFSYTGFDTTTRYVDSWEGIDRTTAAFRPDATLSGSFTGADTDGDGILELPELTGFTLGDTDFFHCAPDRSGDMAGYQCTIDRFSYGPDGKLDVAGGWYQYGEVYWSKGANIDTALGTASDSQQGRYTGEYTTYAWTDQTRLAVAPAPVPEPAPGAMAAAGVLLLGVLTAGARRSRSGQAA